MSEKFPKNLNGIAIHLVGIKGTGMAALAEILSARGAVITGSDVSERFYTDEILEKLGITVLPFSEKNVSSKIKFIVYSSAYSADKNPDLMQAAKLEIPCFLYSEVLGMLSESAFSCGICGVHGKTTTTGLTGTILKHISFPAQVLAGSIISSFGDSCTMSNGNDFFVAETCEYQRHFMAFSPKKIILTSVESDHQDYYPTYEDILNAFVDYILKLPEKGQLIYCADDKGAFEAAEKAHSMRPDIQLIPYGKNAEGDYKVTFGEIKEGKHFFTLGNYGEFAICVPGDHNVLNSAAAVALTVELLRSKNESEKNAAGSSSVNFDPSVYMEEIKNALLEFKGGKRRSEIAGTAKNKYGKQIIFIDDYGHHPTAIKTTLKGYREFYKNHRIIVDFMSHTYTRTQALLEEFASCFESADNVIINKIYGSARENMNSASVTGEILAERAKKYHKNVVYAGEFDEAEKIALEYLSEKNENEEKYSDGFIFVTMGAGDNWKIGKNLLEKLK